jgi:hypothetical protein
VFQAMTKFRICITKTNYNMYITSSSVKPLVSAVQSSGFKLDLAKALDASLPVKTEYPAGFLYMAEFFVTSKTLKDQSCFFI